MHEDAAASPLDGELVRLEELDAFGLDATMRLGLTAGRPPLLRLRGDRYLRRSRRDAAAAGA